MEISTEIRWFFSGKVPGFVQSWFLGTSRFGDALTEYNGDERIDLYLLADGRIDISPKLREGKLEIKVRNQAEEFTDSSGFYSGASVAISIETAGLTAFCAVGSRVQAGLSSTQTNRG